MRSTSLVADTSVLTVVASPPRASISVASEASSSCRRAASTTLAPFAAKASAVALPIPLLAPVISATRPFISDIRILPSLRLKPLRNGSEVSCAPQERDAVCVVVDLMDAGWRRASCAKLTDLLGSSNVLQGAHDPHYAM